MTVKEFVEWLNENRVAGDLQLRVVADGGIGRTGRDIKQMTFGFDWEHGSLLIHTEQRLCVADDR